MSLTPRSKVPRAQKYLEDVSKSGVHMRTTKANDATVDLEVQNKRIMGWCAEDFKGEGLGKKLETVREKSMLT